MTGRDINESSQTDRRDDDDELIARIRAHEDRVAKDGESDVDPGESEQAMDELFDRYKGLVRKQARALYLIGGDNDDLIQEGMIALYKAIRGYDGESNPGTFAAYASTCISNHLYNVIKRANRLKNAPLNQSISLDAPLGGTLPEDVRTVADTLPPDTQSDPAEILIDRENVLRIEELIETRLSPFEQEVVRLYIDGNSLSGIAAALGKPSKSIDNALQRVKKKLSG